jgi:hypothetical protein
VPEPHAESPVPNSNIQVTPQVPVAEPVPSEIPIAPPVEVDNTPIVTPQPAESTLPEQAKPPVTPIPEVPVAEPAPTVSAPVPQSEPTSPEVPQVVSVANDVQKEPSLSVDTLFSGNETPLSPAPVESGENTPDSLPEFPAPPPTAAPLMPKSEESAQLQPQPTTVTDSQALHILEHPKDAGPVKSNNDKTASPDNTQTPEALWHAAIGEMDHCQQPLLKAYMQEGRPQSFINGELTVVYDEESEAMHISEIRKEKALIETCLRRLSSNKCVSLNVAEKKGILSPHEVIHQNSKDLEAIQKRAENNPFVKDVLDLFDAEIVDVKG